MGMNDRMNHRYRVFRRGWGTFYCEDLQTGKQESLRTRDKPEAYRLVAARNEVERQPAFALHLARLYWKAADPAAAKRAVAAAPAARVLTKTVREVAPIEVIA